MGIDALIPIQEAFHVNLVTDFQVLHCCVNIRGVVAQVGLYREGINISVQRYIEVQIIAVLTGTVPFIQKSNFVSGIILACSFHRHALEGHELILVFDKVIGSQKRGYVQCLSYVGASLLNLKGCVL